MTLSPSQAEGARWLDRAGRGLRMVTVAIAIVIAVSVAVLPLVVMWFFCGLRIHEFTPSMYGMSSMLDIL
jgi:hypothetical protein